MECHIKLNVKPSCIEITGIVKYADIIFVNVNSTDFNVDILNIWIVYSFIESGIEHLVETNITK